MVVYYLVIERFWCLLINLEIGDILFIFLIRIFLRIYLINIIRCLYILFYIYRYIYFLLFVIGYIDDFKDKD